MRNLTYWFLLGLALLALIGALRWIAFECPEGAPPGPTIGSKLWGC